MKRRNLKEYLPPKIRQALDDFVTKMQSNNPSIHFGGTEYSRVAPSPHTLHREVQMFVRLLFVAVFHSLGIKQWRHHQFLEPDEDGWRKIEEFMNTEEYKKMDVLSFTSKHFGAMFEGLSRKSVANRAVRFMCSLI